MNRFALARREAALCLLLTLLYFAAWYGSAYFIPEDMELWDMPLWFVLSCILMPLLFIGLCALMVDHLFVDIPLDTEEPVDSPQQGTGTQGPAMGQTPHESSSDSKEPRRHES